MLKRREEDMGSHSDKVCTLLFFICILRWFCNASSELIVGVLGSFYCAHLFSQYSLFWLCCFPNTRCFGFVFGVEGYNYGLLWVFPIAGENLNYITIYS